MSKDQLDAALQAFRRRRPFCTFMIEFTSGRQVKIPHPEAVRSEAKFYVTRGPDGGYVLFTADSVARLLDVPPVAAKQGEA